MIINVEVIVIDYPKCWETTSVAIVVLLGNGTLGGYSSNIADCSGIDGSAFDSSSLQAGGWGRSKGFH